MRVIMSCAGTGGHIYPAIAIADKIKREDPSSEIIFIGTKKGMENRLVPAAGYEVKGIAASGFNRKNPLKNFRTVADILQGSREASAIMEEFRPDMVIGTGGYVTGIVIRMAHKKGIPCYIHEQNAIPGMANKMLEKYARKVFISFEDSRKYLKEPEKAVLTGNPIRNDFLRLDRESCRKELGVGDGDLAVLAFGGSLGAEILNKAVIRLSENMPDGLKLFFVTGKRYYDDIASSMGSRADGGRIVLIPYADNMPQLILASDLVISRAGAIAVSEITACGKPSVLIPSPNVTNNHQYHNAKAIADAGAAVLLEEKEFGADYSELADAVNALAADSARMAEMSECARRAGRTDAVDLIYGNLK